MNHAWGREDTFEIIQTVMTGTPEVGPRTANGDV